ncbi:hypothetical protein OOT08_08440, partial [Leucobacter sp. M11]|nr:hypothetical protein [Leucobacter sp. M11]
WFGHPAVLAAITLSAATLVTWSFWPRRERPARRAVSAPGPARRATNRARHAAAPGRVGAVGLALFLGLGLALSPGSRPALASAAEPEAGGAIRISSVASPRIAQLSPGDSGDWDLTVDTSRAPAGTLTVSLQASGDAGLGLTLAVRACAEGWTATGCGRGERTVAERRVADLSGAERRVTDARTRGTLWLRVTGSVPEDARPEPGERVQLTAVVRAGEETVRHDLPADGWPAGGLPVPGVSGLANTGQVTDA